MPGVYGVIKKPMEQRLLYAHRASYEMFVGPIPEGLHLDHLCRVTLCVRPGHLEPVTLRENTLRGRAGDYQRAKTHCPSGHEYTEENMFNSPKGHRICKPCNYASRAKHNGGTK